MKKFISIICFLLILSIIFIALGKNYIAKRAIIKTIKNKTGFESNIEKVNVGLIKSTIDIKNIKLFNPNNFSNKALLVAPQILADYSLSEILKNKIHFKDLKFNLQHILIEKNKIGELNIQKLKKISKPEQKVSNQKKDEKKYKLIIDNLHIIFGKIIYANETGKTERVITLNLDKKFKNIKSLSQLKQVLTTQLLVPATFQQLQNLNFNDYEENLGDMQNKIENLDDDSKKTIKEFQEEMKQKMEKTLEDVENTKKSFR